MPKDEDAIYKAAIGPPIGGVAPVVRFKDSGAMHDIGFLSPIRDGSPIPPGGEMVRLTERGDGMFNCRTLHKGPAKVNSEAYRVNWESIFGARCEEGQA